MYKIAVLVGSIKPNSVNLKLVRALEKLSVGRLQFDYVDIGSLPFYDDRHWENPPAAVLDLKAKLDAADGVLIATPEYNRSIPGVLKNAIDWGSRPWGKSSWAGKPTAIVGATGGAVGTAVAQSHLRSVMTMLDVALMGQPEIYFTMKPGLIDDDYLIIDDTTHAFLSGWVQKYVAWVRRFAAPQDLKIAAE